jgi:hypothetical protein
LLGVPVGWGGNAMATYQKRKNLDGSTAVIAWVRIRPYKPASKSLPDMAKARAWATALEAELKTHVKAGEVRKDITTMTIKALIEDYLADPEAKQLRTYDDVERLLAWWVNHFGAEKILEFGAIKLREARELLRSGRANGTVNRYLGGLRSCLSWGRAAQYIPTERIWPTRLFLTEPRELVRFLSDHPRNLALGFAHIQQGLDRN